MMCRFYGFNLVDVGKMTIEQFTIMFGHISDIQSYETTGKMPSEPISGPMASKLISRLLPQRKKK